jgi:WD40 repeat protein
VPGVSESRRRPLAFVWHAKLDDYITAVAWSPDGRQLAAASVSGQLGIYDAEKGQGLHILDRAHADGGDAVAWRPDGRALATAGRDGTWRLWDPTEGRQMIECEAGAPWPEHLAWSPAPLDAKGHRLALGAGSRVSFWTEAGESAGEAISFPRTVAQIAWVLGGKTLAVATSAGVSLRDPLTGTGERAFSSRDAMISMAFSPSGKWLLTGNQDCSVHVWNTDSNAEMHMRGYAAKVRHLMWHRGSRWLATDGGPTISVWDCSGPGPQGRTPTLLEWHTDLVTALHYQPQGDWLASGSRDGGVAIWSPTQRQTLITAGKISSGVTRVAWSPDGRLLAATGEAGEIQVLAVE